MATVLNNDTAIWLKNVNADSDVIALLRQIGPGTRVHLEIEGVPGYWEKMANYKNDGRPTHGLKPVGPTQEWWKKMAARRGEHLRFRVVDPRDTFLEALQPTLSEWNSAEDDQAFRDL